MYTLWFLILANHSFSTAVPPLPDYLAVNQQLVFSSGGSLRQMVPITTLDDSIFEGTQEFTLSLSSDNAQLSNPTATVAILDDDTSKYIHI